VSDRSLADKEISATLNPYDLCKVWLCDGRGKRWIDIVGLIQADSLSVAETDGRPQNEVRLTLAGLGEALEKYQVFWHPHIAGQSNLGGIGWLVRAKGNTPRGRVDEVLTQIFDAFLNDKYVFTLADGRPLYQVLSKNFQTITGGLSTLGLQAMGMEGALWATLKRYSDAPWCELFVDIQHERGVLSADVSLLSSTYAETVGLYLRPTPFSVAKWRSQAKEEGWGFEYEDSERLGGEQLVRDTNNIYNFFWCPEKAVYSSFDQLSMAYNQSGGKVPIYDEASIRKYGLRRLEQGTEYIESLTVSDEKGGALAADEKTRMQTAAAKKADLLVTRTRQLHQWFGYDQFYEGTIATRGRIGSSHDHGGRIGGVLTRKRDGRQFYITGIQQNWSFPGPHTTVFQVSRGHDPDKYLSWIREHCGEVDV
jgi:hypothetical protein